MAKWTPDELNLLQTLVGDIPWPMVFSTYNEKALKNRLPERTAVALRRKCDDLGLQRRCVGEWITSGVVCKLLNTNYEQVNAWIQRGWLPAVRFGDSPSYSYYFTRTNLCKLAKQKPYLFGGQTEPNLIQLLNNENLAKQIAAKGFSRMRQAKAVVCVETGQQYPSIAQAARAVFVTSRRLQKVVDKNLTAAGYHWKRIK